MKRTDSHDLLRAIAEGTGWATGHEFFETLVRCLAEALDTPAAFVCEFQSDKTQAHTLAYWLDGQFLGEFDYPLAGTPCEEVLNGRIVPYARRICELFPSDGDLKIMQAESYLAIPLKTLEGNVVGHLAVIDRKARDWYEADFGILRIFAARTTAEFERRSYEVELESARLRLEEEIAARKEIEIALRASEQSYKEMYEEAPIVYWSTGTDRRIRQANRRAGELFGYTTAELIGSDVMDLIAVSATGRDRAAAIFARFLHGEAIFDEEVEFVARDGSPIWGSVSITPHRNAQGQIESTRSAVTNITARKRAEMVIEHRLALENLIAKVSTRFVSIAADQIDCRIEGSLREIGQTYGIDGARVYSFTGDCLAVLTHSWARASDLPGNDGQESLPEPRELKRDDLPELFDAILANQVLGNSQLADLPGNYTAFRQCLRDQPAVCLTVVPLAYANVIVGMLALDGISDTADWPEEDVRLLRLLGEIIAGAMHRRDAEAALDEARLVAESASVAKSRFLANMSHELRTPLNGILGYAQLLERDATLDSQHKDAINRIEHCGKHLLGLINDVLDLTKIEAGKIELDPTELSLGSLLEDVAAITRLRTTQAGLEFVCEMIRPLPDMVRLDERRLRQVLLNLLGNATKYTPKGEVRLRVAARPLDGSRWQLRMEVHDTGIGIAEHDMDKIFEPFQQLRLKNMASEGTGLGLAITRELVAAMDGSLHVTSAVNEGSVFALELIVEEASVRAVKNAARRRRICGYRGARKRVLVVDDKADNRRVLETLLRPLGFDLREAVNGAEALELTEKLNPDIIFMDLVMPVLDGFEATRRLRQGPHSCTPIIAISASAFDETRRQSRGAGCDDFVPKPIQLDDVLRKMERLLGLRWLYADKVDPVDEDKTADDSEAGIPPPAAILVRMYDFARQGDIAGVDECLADIEKLGAAHTDFVLELRPLARNFDMRRIREHLRPFVETVS